MELGATPASPKRAVEALKHLRLLSTSVDVLTYPREMGENEAKACGFAPILVGSVESDETTSTDTKNAAKEMEARNVDLILFSGGDGTARDIFDVVGDRVPVLGVPSGVKIHSATFAINPAAAGELAATYLKDGLPLRDAEVMDIDEDAFRKGLVRARLYGYLRVPYQRRLIQDAKVGSSHQEDEDYEKKIIAEYVTEGMEDDCYYIIGPGSTTKPIADLLGFEKTLLGVDVTNRGVAVVRDANEKQLMQLIANKKVKIVITPIGGQGHIFGRGNQQISPSVIRVVGRDNIIIVATRMKINSLIGKPLLVDTGDAEVDRMLTGYMRVIVGYKEEVVKKVE